MRSLTNWIMLGPTARRGFTVGFLKLADLEDNMDFSRIPHPTAKDHARVEKYLEAKRVIEKTIAG
jgi:hypothetical protein